MPNFAAQPPGGVSSLSNVNGFVHVEKSVTVNPDPAKFESAKVTIGMTLPVDFTDEDLAKAKEAMSILVEAVDERLNDEAALIYQDGDVANHLEQQYIRMQQKP